MIYLDNAATTFPKPRRVIESVRDAMLFYGANPGRGSFDMAIKAADKIYSCRETAAKMFNADGAEQVIFTQNCTHAINIVLKGLLHAGDHVIVSSLEHNAVMRPIKKLERRGVTYSIAKVCPDSKQQTLKNFERLIRSNTKMIFCMHASNVFGVVLPIEQIGALCRRRNIVFCVDAAQSAGVLPIDVKKMNVSFLCLPGHKGLYGPMGTGMLIINSRLRPDTLIEGGTGNNSALFTQPDEYPERLESGTINLPGIIGLKAGMDFVNEVGAAELHGRETALAQSVYDCLSGLPDAVLHTKRPDENCIPIVSFNILSKDSAETGSELSRRGICVRTGLHCAVSAHRQFGTEKTGTVRISPGAFTTPCDIEILNKSLKYITF